MERRFELRNCSDRTRLADIPSYGKPHEHSWCAQADGTKVHQWRSQGFGAKWPADAVVGCAADLDAGELRFGVNGEWGAPYGLAFAGVVGVALYPAVTLASGRKARVNFGQRAWKVGPGARLLTPLPQDPREFADEFPNFNI